MATTDSEQLRQQKSQKEEKQEKEPSWMNRLVHGMPRWRIEVADTKKSYQWLHRAGLKDSTEGLIMAAQANVLSTRSIETHQEKSQYRL